MLGARASFKNMSVEALLDLEPRLELGKEEKADGTAGDMNLRKQIRSVVIRYLELELKGKLIVFQVCGRLLVLGIQLSVFPDYFKPRLFLNTFFKSLPRCQLFHWE